MSELKVKTWATFKSFVDAREVSIQWLDLDDHYYMYAIDGAFTLRYIMKKDNGSDQTDFETNYKDAGNKKLNPLKDTDGAILSRTKITEAGWHFQAHAFEFTTSHLTSVYSKDLAENDLNFVTIKCYNSSDVELTTQASCDTDCVRTVIEWEPTHDFEVLGGHVFQETAPTNDTRLWIRAVPDVPKALGGSVDFIQGGVNLKLLGNQGEIDLDGRTAKRMAYDSTYHTNKFQIVVTHSAGDKCPLMFVAYIFKKATD